MLFIHLPVNSCVLHPIKIGGIVDFMSFSFLLNLFKQVFLMHMDGHKCLYFCSVNSRCMFFQAHGCQLLHNKIYFLSLFLHFCISLFLILSKASWTFWVHIIWIPSRAICDWYLTNSSCSMTKQSRAASLQTSRILLCISFSRFSNHCSMFPSAFTFLLNILLQYLFQHSAWLKLWVVYPDHQIAF